MRITGTFLDEITHDIPLNKWGEKNGRGIANSELISKHSMRPWLNVESSDRDMPIDFPPIDWRKLWWKMQAVERSGVEKLITFEFSHCTSPKSCWSAAANLLGRYSEHLEREGAE